MTEQTAALLEQTCLSAIQQSLKEDKLPETMLTVSLPGDLCCQVEHALKLLEESVREYNLTAHRLALIPISAKRGNGIQYEIELNRTADAASALISIDLKVNTTDEWRVRCKL